MKEIKTAEEILHECTTSNVYTREQVESICRELLGIAAVNLNIGIVTDKRIDTGLYWKHDDGIYQMVEINRNSITDTITNLDEIINSIKK